MLSEEAVAILSSLEFRADARRRIMVFGAVIWDDELPEGLSLARIRGADRRQIMRLLWMRVQLWRNRELSKDDLELWEAIRAQLPNWAFWRRPTATNEILESQDAAEQEARGILKAFCGGPDDVTVSEKDHITTFSVNFKHNENVS